ncbi:AMP-binding protein [Oceanibacterium hippocampi]|uniref:Long-chain-fatty-acid--CoA ligase n=1 Tax=Oceanibacterium hippocampi TaxID=745714 RepID=A0A1Y5U069_9PROT|nr:AMP-binding protein [Oceanibacterium hippocampi]SLN72871.1 Long-chain-fatty-acid--CoA ligase [Oceanibacterium hippocampi]
MSLHLWIERWAEHRPGATAIAFEDTDLSYAMLAARIRRLAAALDAAGIEAGDRVAHLGNNRPEAIELVFACAHRGALLVPLNWRLTPHEHAAILADSAPKLLFADAAFAEHVAGIGTPAEAAIRVCLDGRSSGMTAYQAFLEAALDNTPPARGEPADPLLLVYTSGTTGQAKGAVLTQEAVFYNAVNATHAHDLTAADHVLTNLPLFHVGGLNIQTLPALHAGARVTLHRRFDPGLALRDIARLRPTLVLMVPATMAAMIGHDDWATTDLGSLRLAMAGSSTVPLALIEAFHARRVPVGQVYGSTETAPVAICLRAEDAMAHAGSCGKAALHCEIRLVDDRDRDVGVGERGEILVRGRNIMRNYWNNPAATAEAFLDGWYRTGDIGHRDAAGFCYIDDRKKNVIISGGENIYPAELEQVLARMDELAEYAVVARPDARWGEVPVVYAVAKPGSTIDAATILGRFEGVLARYKHPRAVEFRDSLPRNALGKVQHFRLRAAETAAAG